MLELCFMSGSDPCQSMWSMWPAVHVAGMWAFLTCPAWPPSHSAAAPKLLTAWSGNNANADLIVQDPARMGAWSITNNPPNKGQGSCAFQSPVMKRVCSGHEDTGTFHWKLNVRVMQAQESSWRAVAGRLSWARDIWMKESHLVVHHSWSAVERAILRPYY